MYVVDNSSPLSIKKNLILNFWVEKSSNLFKNRPPTWLAVTSGRCL